MFSPSLAAWLRMGRSVRIYHTLNTGCSFQKYRLRLHGPLHQRVRALELASFGGLRKTLKVGRLAQVSAL
jgi:hypothetical protein